MAHIGISTGGDALDYWARPRKVKGASAMLGGISIQERIGHCAGKARQQDVTGEGSTWRYSRLRSGDRGPRGSTGGDSCCYQYAELEHAARMLSVLRVAIDEHALKQCFMDSRRQGGQRKAE